ncbi:hypothetical protein [Deinococcus sp. UYEF24]
MSELKPALVVFVDVDETFVRNYGTARIPIPVVLRHVRSLFEQGADLYCWSSGGAEYARSSAEEMGIGDCFRGYLPKPQVMIDDQNVSEWRRLIQVHPNRCDGQTVEEYRMSLRSSIQPGRL